MPDVNTPAPHGAGSPAGGRKEHVLITGGLGFIGTHVADGYLAAGHKVTLLDSMVAAVTDGEWYEGNRDVAILKMSVDEFFAKGNTLEPYDRIIHAASHVGPAGILKYVGRLGFEIVRATQEVVEACIKYDKPLVTFSSAEVYGRSGNLAETDTIQVPVDYNSRIEYAIAKTLTECLVVNSTKRGLRGIIIRPFNVTGPRQSSAGGFVMPTFVQQAQAGQPITVFAGGEQTRAFLSATDLCRFLVEFMDKAIASPHYIFNVGNPDNTISMRNLGFRIKEMTGSTSEVVDADAKKIHGELYEEALSIHKIPVLANARSVGWEPRVTLEELIRETIEFYGSHKDLRALAMSRTMA